SAASDVYNIQTLLYLPIKYTRVWIISALSISVHTIGKHFTPDRISVSARNPLTWKYCLTSY
ncbi:MAG: hypothetical protein K2H31_03290, partial [Lachnospiraceae bacterium]|nr:hypothetical protein [Lachnospiraceae bacterium]